MCTRSWKTLIYVIQRDVSINLEAKGKMFQILTVSLVQVPVTWSSNPLNPRAGPFSCTMWDNGANLSQSLALILTMRWVKSKYRICSCMESLLRLEIKNNLVQECLEN